MCCSRQKINFAGFYELPRIFSAWNTENVKAGLSRIYKNYSLSD